MTVPAGGAGAAVEGIAMQHHESPPSVRDHERHPFTLGDALSVALLLVTMAALGVVAFYEFTGQAVCR